MAGQVVERQSGRTGNHEQQQRDIGIGGAAESQEHMQNVGKQGKKRNGRHGRDTKDRDFAVSVSLRAKRPVVDGLQGFCGHGRLAFALPLSVECNWACQLTIGQRLAVAVPPARLRAAAVCYGLGGASPACCPDGHARLTLPPQRALSPPPPAWRHLD